MDNFSVDAYTPKELAARIEKAGISKSSSDLIRILALAILAGAFIALGVVFYTTVTFDSQGVPAGIVAMQQADFVTLLGDSVDVSNMTLSGFFITNLLPVTLGNIVGGSIFVALFYWFIYLRH